MSDSRTDGWPQPLVGSTVQGQATLGNNHRLVLVDANGRLDVVIGGGAPADINLAQVGGTNTVTAGVNGLLAVGGAGAHDAAISGNPVRVGGRYQAAPGTVDDGDTADVLVDASGRIEVVARGNVAHDAVDAGNPVKVGGRYQAAPAAVGDGDRADLLMDSIGQARTANDIVRIGGNAVASVGVNGMLAIGGDAADDAASTASNPAKVGAVADEVISAVADDDMVHLITDLYRRLRIVSASFDTLTESDKVSNLNLISTDYDNVAQSWADETNVAAGSQYYPSSAGHEIGTRTNLGIVFGIANGSIDAEVSNDGTNWVTATKTLFDVAQGSAGYDNTHYVEAAGSTTYFAVSWEKIEFRYIRFEFVRTNATNTVIIDAVTRAH